MIDVAVALRVPASEPARTRSVRKRSGRRRNDGRADLGPERTDLGQRWVIPPDRQRPYPRVRLPQLVESTSRAPPAVRQGDEKRPRGEGRSDGIPSDRFAGDGCPACRARNPASASEEKGKSRSPGAFFSPHPPRAGEFMEVRPYAARERDATGRSVFRGQLSVISYQLSVISYRFSVRAPVVVSLLLHHRSHPGLEPGTQHGQLALPPQRISVAFSAASTRVRTFSFRKRLCRCTLTVCSLILSIVASSLLRYPSPRSPRS